MRVVFWTSDKEREHATADLVRRAVEDAGDQFVERCTAVYDGPDLSADVVCSIGVKGKTRWILEGARKIGQQFLLFDKAILYSKGARRTWEMWKVSLNALFPTDYMMRWADDGSRFRELGWSIADPVPWTPGKAVAFVGSSQKHCDWHGVGDAQQFAEKICKKLWKLTERQVIYRPKPSWDGARPIKHTVYSPPGEPFASVLDRCCLIAVLGSNASAEALASGITTAVLGANVANPIVGVTDLSTVHKLRCPSREDRQRWLNAVAWCQWRADEMPQMWGVMRDLMLEPLREPPPWAGSEVASRFYGEVDAEEED